jgi:putative two-component system response regulator
MKILVVDDDQIALAVAKKVLSSDGHTITLAEDGAEALEILQQENIQLVISDWNMPNMDGIQLCRELRKFSSLGYIYVIMITARNSKEDMLEGLEAGADDFISKPFEPAELLVRVRNAERLLNLETTKTTLFLMSKLAESKDPDTGAHLERIRAYSRLLAQQLLATPGFNEHVPHGFAELLYETSPLHDCGKVAIPDYVLLKPGSLNDEEWAVMKQHAQRGAEVFEDSLKSSPDAEFLRMACDVAWAHHERWDGSGYPRGLKGTDIPLSARIVALADAYDAITSRRPYKTARSHEVAAGILFEGSGRHFDPQIVDAFRAVVTEFENIQLKFKE